MHHSIRRTHGIFVFVDMISATVFGFFTGWTMAHVVYDVAIVLMSWVGW